MRTKVLLGAAVLAASLASSMADGSNVYSLNVVGYVNQTVQANRWYLFGNPLQAVASNTSTVLTNLASAGGMADFGNHIDGTQPGSIAYCYNQPNGVSGGFGSPDQFYWDTPDTYFGWVEAGNVDLTPGHGFWFYSTGTGTITFVGNVATTNTFQLVPSWNLVSSAFPATLSLAALGIQGSAPASQVQGGDFIYRWNTTQLGYTNQFDDGVSYWNDPLDTFFGWVSNDHGDTSGVEGPVLYPGEGIWYNKTGSAATWTQTFTIQ
jgi:hypothetical protein